MQSKALFTFGPDDVLYTRAGPQRVGKWEPYGNRLSERTKELLRENRPTEDFCALGSEDVVYLWMNAAGRWLWYLRSPDKLNGWLLDRSNPSSKRLRRDANTLHITLGPNNSFYAHDRSDWISGNLPAALDELVISSYESLGKPTCVALGADGAWVYIDAAKKAHWHLPNYPRLRAVLERTKSKPCFVSLDCAKPGNFFVAFTAIAAGETACDFSVSTTCVSTTIAFTNAKPDFDGFGGARANPSSSSSSNSSSSGSKSNSSSSSTKSGSSDSGEAERLRAENRRLASELKRLEGSFGELRKTLGELQERCAAERAENDSLRSAKSRAESEAADLAKSVKELSGYCDDWKEMYDSLLTEKRKGEENAQQEIRRARSSSSLAPAAAMVQANNVANRDFMLRQALQARQYNQQSMLTSLQNMSAMNNAAMMNMTIW